MPTDIQRVLFFRSGGIPVSKSIILRISSKNRLKLNYHFLIFRLEPLLSRHYAKIAPVTIHTYNAPVKPRYCDMPREKITIVSSKTASDNTNTATATSSLPVPFADPSTIPTVTQRTPTNKPTLPSMSMPAMPSLLPSPSKG